MYQSDSFSILVLQIANCGPADYNFEESVSTLRYANRAKNIKNNAKINEDPKDALLRQFQLEIEKLKKQLEGGGKWFKFKIRIILLQSFIDSLQRSSSVQF